MTCGELMEYLKGFEVDSVVAFIIADTGKRIVHTVDNYIFITGEDNPAVIINTSQNVSMDELPHV